MLFVGSMAARSRSRNPRVCVSRGGQIEFDSKLASYFVEQWSWGHLSACDVQRQASLALADQRDMLNRLQVSSDYASKSLVKLAAIGSEGRNDGNCKRDLIRALGDPSFF